MPDCYFVISMNPKSRDDITASVNSVLDAVGVAPEEAPIYFDYVSEKAHVFVPFQDGAQLLTLIGGLKTTLDFLEFAVVGTRDDPDPRTR